MRNRNRFILAGLAAFVLVLGAFVSLSGLRPDTRPAVLVGEAVFPDHSAGHPVGPNAANAVGVRLSFATRTPWIQGERHEIVLTVDATPGSGVASVDLTTLILYLVRPAMPRRDIVNSDLVLLESSGANRWISMDGPLVIYPNSDVTGSNFFLAVALSLNVYYTNGQTYGWGGWDPGIRIISPNIVPDYTPIGLMMVAAGSAGLIFTGLTWKSVRPNVPAVSKAERPN
ncbi:MAG: hypothetical protein E6J92_08660 [Methanobacteriota archaeon]|nr:MAG: hypothetical protein E6J92_08660 [Euryarchaeota archaeon]